jgi:hypothetical protein
LPAPDRPVIQTIKGACPFTPARASLPTVRAGDSLRFGLNKDLGFTDADRVENVRRTAEVAKLMPGSGQAGHPDDQGRLSLHARPRLLADRQGRPLHHRGHRLTGIRELPENDRIQPNSLGRMAWTSITEEYRHHRCSGRQGGRAVRGGVHAAGILP